jgi:hypothetical protein
MMLQDLQKELEALTLKPIYGTVRVPSVQRSFVLLARQENFYLIGYDKHEQMKKTIQRYYYAILELFPNFVFITPNANNNIEAYYHVDDKAGLRVLHTQPLIGALKAIPTVGRRNTQGIFINTFLDHSQPLDFKI